MRYLMALLLVLGLVTCQKKSEAPAPTPAAPRVEEPAPEPAEPTPPPAEETKETPAPAADYPAEVVEEGKQLFLNTCSTCHGPDAKGLPGLGKNLHDNQYVRSHTDEEMLEFLKTGRPASDPLNTTGVDMPPRGGNPSLTDEDLQKIIAYLRTLGNAYDQSVPKPEEQIQEKS